MVFGKPIDYPKLTREEITQEIIDKYHTAYMNGLREVFDAYKHQFYTDGSVVPKMEFH